MRPSRSRVGHRENCPPGTSPPGIESESMHRVRQRRPKYTEHLDAWGQWGCAEWGWGDRPCDEPAACESRARRSACAACPHPFPFPRRCYRPVRQVCRSDSLQVAVLAWREDISALGICEGPAAATAELPPAPLLPLLLIAAPG